MIFDILGILAILAIVPVVIFAWIVIIALIKHK